MDSTVHEIEHNHAASPAIVGWQPVAGARVFFHQNADGTIKSARGASREVFGASLQTLHGLRLTNLTAPSAHPALLKALLDARHYGAADLEVDLASSATFGRAHVRIKSLPGGAFVTALMALSREAAPAPERAAVAKGPMALDDAAATEKLANVSHEIRTPLNAVIGFADVLSQESFGPLGDERYRDYAKLIQESGQHVLSLVNDLLDLSKAEADKLTIEKRMVDVPALVEACASMLRLQAEKAGLKLVVKTAPGIGRVSADGKVLRQVIINLLSNALKFTDMGVITIRTRMLDRRLVISVEDTGIGMSEDDLARVGERFYQARSSGVRGARGTGLGVALSQALARAHGGRLDIRSTPGKGTVATLTVPVFESASRASRPTARLPRSAGWLNAYQNCSRRSA